MVSHFFCPSPWSNRKSSPLFLPLADLRSRSPLCVPWGGFRLCYDASNRTVPRPSTWWVGTQKGHFPIAPREWCLATETTAVDTMGKCPELICHCPWFSGTSRHRRRPKALRPATSAVFARIAQEDAADGHHAEQEIVVKVGNDLERTERG